MGLGRFVAGNADLSMTNACHMRHLEIIHIHFYAVNLQSDLSNQIFHFTHCIALKRVTNLPGQSPRHYALAAQLLMKKCRSSGKPSVTLSLTRPIRD